MTRLKILAAIGFSLSVGFFTPNGFAESEGDGGKKGLTLEVAWTGSRSNSGVFVASCDGEKGETCDPYNGDTLCRVKRPLLCTLDIDAPVPLTLEDESYWTGGLLALTSPREGSNFSRLGEANNFCQETFGKNWRVASFHDGGGWDLKGYGTPPLKRTSAWVDIKNQSNATCWAR